MEPRPEVSGSPSVPSRTGDRLAWLPIAAATLTVLTLFGPWVLSGAARRNSFETLRTADRLGQLDGDVLGLLAGMCVFLPAVAALGWVAKLLDRNALAVCVSAAAALGCGLLGAVVWSADVRVGWGPVGSVTGAATTLAAAAWTALRRR